MYSHTISKKYSEVIHHLHDAISAAHVNAETIPLLHHNEAMLRAALDRLEGTATQSGLMAQFRNAQNRKSETIGALRKAARDGRALATACINLLKPRFGNQFNTEWQKIGLDGSLQVAQNPIIVLKTLQLYFINNPTHELSDVRPGISCTAAACEAAIQAIDGAKTICNQSNIELGLARNARDEGLNHARECLRGMAQELGFKLANDDPLWLAYGFDQPTAPRKPEPLENVVAARGTNPGEAFINWDDSPRADHYHIIVTDEAGEVIEDDILAINEKFYVDLPTGIQLSFVVSARTSAGESKACEPIIMVL